MPLAHRWTDSHRAAAGVTCYCDCPLLCLENWRTLHCLRLGRFYPGRVNVRFLMNHVAPSSSVSSYYQKNDFLSCVIWGSKTNCNTEVVQNIAPLNTALVKKILWYFSFRFPSTNRPYLCLLYLQVIYFQVFTVGNKHNLI
jgi:hypothetical protein